ncbi:DUF3225 domain-containing protein [Paraburkholderia sediminicola]|uniref:AtzH-like domain-containing protein n=1 Tax=Paraburkholderia sediminicola TaxID=458836 RepID=UPI0038BBFD00
MTKTHITPDDKHVPLDINRADIIEQVRAAFERYQKAQAEQDLEALDHLFWDSEQTIRFGMRETVWGKSAIRQFRGTRHRPTAAGRIEHLSIATFGDSFGAMTASFRRSDVEAGLGRWTQTWVRFDDGWKIVATHVSPAPDETPTENEPTDPHIR